MKKKKNKKAKSAHKAKATKKKSVKKPRVLKHQKKVKTPLSKKAKDMNAKAQRLFHKGKERGFVTHDEILKEFPHVEDDIFFLDQLYAKLQEGGIDILESGGMIDMGDAEPAKKHVYLGRGMESSYDSIQMYLKEIGQYPLILAQTEKDLAKRIQTGDMEAKNLLARANLRLVVSIAKKYV